MNALGNGFYNSNNDVHSESIKLPAIPKRTLSFSPTTPKVQTALRNRWIEFSKLSHQSSNQENSRRTPRMNRESFKKLWAKRGMYEENQNYTKTKRLREVIYEMKKNSQLNSLNKRRNRVKFIHITESKEKSLDYEEYIKEVKINMPKMQIWQYTIGDNINLLDSISRYEQRKIKQRFEVKSHLIKELCDLFIFRYIFIFSIILILFIFT